MFNKNIISCIIIIISTFILYIYDLYLKQNDITFINITIFFLSFYTCIIIFTILNITKEEKEILSKIFKK